MEIDDKDLQELIPKMKRALSESHNMTATEVLGNLQEFSPVDHGRLAGSWNLRRTGQFESAVGTSVKYALVQNDGSDPYEIFPRNAQALRFTVGGRTIFAKSVKHPGIQGTKYIERAISATENRVPEFVEMALKQEGLI